MKKLFQNIFLILFLSANIFSQDNNSFYSLLNSISSDSIKKHLHVLAHDSLEGRAVGTRGGNIAANYIANQFSFYGLNKIPSENSYFQNIQMHGSTPLNSSELFIIAGTDTFFYDYSEDYFLYRSGQQTFMPTPLPLVFAGYGIVAPEYDYNDYQQINVEGKIVVYLDGEPHSDNPEYFDGNLPTVYSNPELKRRVAFARGAAGTVQISLMKYKNWNSVQKDFQFEDVTLAYSLSGNLNILLNPVSAEKLFYGANVSFNDVLEMHLAKQIVSFDLETKLRFRGVFNERNFISPNVIGMLKGKDQDVNDTYLIVSAHYDHLGIGIPVNGDSIYNGALDNAIGVSVLLELARIFSLLEIKPKRSILFIATTGEEKGLLGSTYYTDNPIVPLYKSIANVNIDGIAMFEDFKSIVALGSEFSTLGNHIEKTTERFGITLQGIPDQFKKVGAFNNSDQLAFAMAGIPSIIILEGTKHEKRTEEEVLEAFIKYYLDLYHTPLDNLEQVIDYAAAAKHAKVLFDFCFHLANGNETPEWYQGVPYSSIRLRTIAEEK